MHKRIVLSSIETAIKKAHKAKDLEMLSTLVAAHVALEVKSTWSFLMTVKEMRGEVDRIENEVAAHLGNLSKTTDVNCVEAYSPFK